MIKNNFNELLLERRLKITRVSNDTGISRTTLTSISQGHSKGVQNDTLDTLCNYFKITPGEFFDYIPYKIDFNLIQENDISNITEREDLNYEVTTSFTLFIEIVNIENNVKYTYELPVEVSFLYNSHPNFDGEQIKAKIKVTIEADEFSMIFHENSEYTNNEFTFRQFLNTLSITWQTEISNKIRDYLFSNELIKINCLNIEFTNAYAPFQPKF